MRFLGVLNAAVWLGAAVFRVAVVAPATDSRAMQELFGAGVSSYFSGATELIIAEHCFYLQFACAIIAFALAQVERLYLGRELKSFWVCLLAAMIVLGFTGGFWLNPKLTTLHRAQHARLASPQAREDAAKSFRVWQGVNSAVNFFLLAGSGALLWRAGRPPTTTRFLDPGKLRG